MAGHSLADRRSLAYHREVARRIVKRPLLLQRVRERVRYWQQEGGTHPYYSQQWQQLLEKSPSQIAEVITSQEEYAKSLRQTSPFAGILSPQERWAIWREVRDQDP